MAIEKTITMRQFNGTDYDTLYPKTIASQVKGIYNKEETLSSSVAALYGLSGIDAIPNNVFNQLFYSIRYGVLQCPCICYSIPVSIQNLMLL